MNKIATGDEKDCNNTYKDYKATPHLDDKWYKEVGNEEEGWRLGSNRNLEDTLHAENYDTPRTPVKSLVSEVRVDPILNSLINSTNNTSGSGSLRGSRPSEKFVPNQSHPPRRMAGDEMKLHIFREIATEDPDQHWFLWEAV